LREGGAGIGIEDTSLICLEACGFGEKLKQWGTLPMRQQIHCTNNKVIFRSNFPYVSCYWNDVYQTLYNALPEGMVHFGRSFTEFHKSETGGLVVSFEDGDKVRCDAVIGCDGPTSSVRQFVHGKTKMNYRGYTAWRGYLDKSLAPPAVIEGLYKYYDSLEGGVYFHVGSRESGHIVVYELPSNADTGRKINFLWYRHKEKYEDEILGSGKDVGRDKRITHEAHADELAEMRFAAYKFWPKEVADYIAEIPEPFMNDIYDMDPVEGENWGVGPVTLVGDAGQSITPHFLKSSNKAICDAVELAIRLSKAEDISEAFRSYEVFRKPLAARTVAISRKLGMVRQGLEPGSPQSAAEWEELSKDAFMEMMGDGRPSL